jgi:hypothetical protein
LASAPSREDAEKGLFADLDSATRAWVLDRYTPHPTGTSETPVKLTDFWDQKWKATVIWCRNAPNPGEAHQRRAVHMPTAIDSATIDFSVTTLSGG